MIKKLIAITALLAGLQSAQASDHTNPATDTIPGTPQHKKMPPARKVELKKATTITVTPESGRPLPLYFVNGKRSTKADVDKMDANKIRSINVLKGQEAIKAYGDVGKHGVIEVTTN